MTGIVPFIDARPGDESYTFRPDPSGEFGWVTDPEWFDDIDGPVTVTRQRWMLVAEETVVFHPSTELCPTCHGDEEIPEDDPPGPDGGGYHMAACPTCAHDPGRHPFAGQMEVLHDPPPEAVGAS